MSDIDAEIRPVPEPGGNAQTAETHTGETPAAETSGSVPDGSAPGPASGPPRSQPNRTLLLAAFGFLVFWIVYLAFFAPRPPLASIENAEGGPPAEYDWSMDALDGGTASFSQFRGKPVFLNIWATWCPPCVKEMPSIAKLTEDPRLRDKGVAFVCVSTDDTNEAVQRFLKGRSWNMKFFRAQKLPDVFMTDGIPATFIIAPDGRIASSTVGGRDWNSPEVVDLLEKLAAR